jgi:histidyl-tRNA synthetase
VSGNDSDALRPVKGMRDFYPADLRKRAWIFDLWRRVALSYGYEEYDACVLESEELFVRKAGDEVTEQLFNFVDKGGRRVSLRPEVTPSLVRMLRAAGSEVSYPARWFSIPQCFRYERAQKGRKREHYQWNMDIVGLATPAAEIELMSAQASFLRAAGLVVGGATSQVVFRVSNRQVLEHFLGELGITGDDFVATCILMDKRDKVAADYIVGELVARGVSADSARRILALLDVRGLPALRDAVGEQNPGYRALSELCALGAESGIGETLSVDLSVVRGLSYYTGTVWELFSTTGSVGRAIAGGGRYDRLMETLGGAPTPMVGFGFGDVVISLLLEELKLVPALPARVDDVVYPMKAAYFGTAARLAAALRADDRSVLVELSERRFKHVLKRVGELGAARLFVLGEDEMASGAAKVMFTDGTRREEVVALSSLVPGFQAP